MVGMNTITDANRLNNGRFYKVALASTKGPTGPEDGAVITASDLLCFLVPSTARWRVALRALSLTILLASVEVFLT